MAYYRARSHRPRRFPWIPTVGVLAVVGVVVGWWYWGSPRPVRLTEAEAPDADQARLPAAGESPLWASSMEAGRVDDNVAPDAKPPMADSPGATTDEHADEVLEPQPAGAPPAEPVSVPPQSSESRPKATGEDPDSRPDKPSGNAAVAVARQHYQAGKLIEARQELNALLESKLDNAARAEVRRLLTRISAETVFSKRCFPDDPLVETYTVQPGEVLINIGKRYDVPAGAIMRINGISDATRVRAQQKIKVPRGPFHARIRKSQFHLDVYLGELYVRSFPVALGAERETPEGVWRVKNRLANPTYFPPASAEDKRVIAADDPKNPLGEHWIGLEGIEGDAVGREGYGIHGTIEPDSIGKAVSLGCIRLLNEDVGLLFDLMQPGRSTVTVLP